MNNVSKAIERLPNGESLFIVDSIDVHCGCPQVESTQIKTDDLKAFVTDRSHTIDEFLRRLTERCGWKVFNDNTAPQDYVQALTVADEMKREIGK